MIFKKLKKQRNELFQNEYLAPVESKPKRNKEVANRLISAHLNLSNHNK